MSCKNVEKPPNAQKSAWRSRRQDERSGDEHLTADDADGYRFREKGNTEIEGKDPRTYSIIGEAIEVHRYLGRGFLEGVHQEALAVEFSLREILFQREVDLVVRHKQRDLAWAFRADFVCYSDLIVELKAIPEPTPREHSQIINYLRATGLPIGLLLNFATPRLEDKRFIDSSLIS